MRYFIFSFILITASINCAAQRRITEQDLNRINEMIENKIDSLRDEVYNDEFTSQDDLEFMFKSDTLRINVMMAQKMDINYSTAGMVKAIYDAIEAYKKLIGKYYAMLMKKLEKNNRKALIQAQNSWIKFKNDEMKLNNVLLRRKYSGGSIVYVFRADALFTLTQERAVGLYRHLAGITN